MDYNYNGNNDFNENYENGNNEPIKESKESRRGFIIHIVIGLMVLISYVFAMNSSWFNAFFMLEKIQTIKMIYIIGSIGYFILAIMSQKEIQKNTKKLTHIILNGIKLMVWWGLIIGALFVLTIYHVFFPSSSLGKKDELVINEITIPTLYKYTQYDDILMSVSLQKVPEEDRLDFIVVSYKNSIPLDDLKIYRNELSRLGFKQQYINDVESYFCEVPEKDSYICIAIISNQISYGIVSDEEYGMILNGTWMKEENIF